MDAAPPVILWFRKDLRLDDNHALDAAHPFLTFKIIAGIHGEALKLWLKGARYVGRPAAPPEVSIRQPRPLAEAAE